MVYERLCYEMTVDEWMWCGVRGCVMSGCVMSGGVMSGCVMSGCVMSGCVMSGCVMSGESKVLRVLRSYDHIFRGSCM